MRRASQVVVVAATVLALQVILPRVFSVVLWYHLGFFIVSLALLGGALGAASASRAAARGRTPNPDVDVASLSAAIVVALAIVLRLPLDVGASMHEPGPAALVVVMAAALCAPFFFAGRFVAVALAEPDANAARRYAASFAGGGLGGLAAFALLSTCGAPRALGIVALAPLLLGASKAARGPWSFALVLAGAAAVAPDALFPMESRKHFPRIEPSQVKERVWNSLSRVTFYDNPERHGLWQLRPGFDGPVPDSIGVAIDDWAITSIWRRPTTSEGERFLSAYPPTLAYATAAPGFDALVIGAGGGLDVLGALAARAGHVTAVEINPAIVDAVRGRYAEFAGRLYDDPRVEAHCAEGRAFAQSDTRSYDRVVLTGVDTFAATEAGAFALSENYLYTREAIDTLLTRLKPGGIAAFSRWWYEPERQTVRLVLTLADALRARGLDPAACLFVGRAETNSYVLAKNAPFTDDELNELDRAATLRGIRGVFARGRPSDPLFEKALDAASATALIRDYPYRIEPTTDDRPFFFEHTRWSGAFRGEGDWIHDRVGGIEVLLVTLLALVLLATPLCVVAGRGDGKTRLLPFLAFGVAYTAVEVVLLARLALPLGSPALSVPVTLCVLLVGSGCGAFVASRMPDDRAIRACLVAAAAVVAVGLLAFDLLGDATRTQPLAERATAVAAFLAFPAFVLGMPMTLALRSLATLRRDLVPRALALNGAAAAVAGPLATAAALQWGFSATLCGAALAYVVAAVLLRRHASASLLPSG